MSTLHSPWQPNLPRISRQHRHWLAGKGSLTQKLKDHCHLFGVFRVHQKRAPLQQSESIHLRLPCGRQILQRQVLLLCDGIPAVFAHTVTDCARVSKDWHFFNSLGSRALGVALFANPLIHRLRFEYTRLTAHDALYAAAAAALQQSGTSQPLPPHLWARRCVFSHRRHRNSRMMVTEVMLPVVYTLNATSRVVQLKLDALDK